MNIIFITSEIDPIHKAGGLGDYSRSLPLALKQQQHDIRVILPAHSQISLDSFHFQTVANGQVLYDRQPYAYTVWQTNLPNTNLPVFVISEPDLITQPSNQHETDKYAVFSLAVLDWLQQQSPHWQPDIAHLNDWQTSLIPILLKYRFPQLDIGTLLTIHNLNYQGKTGTQLINKLELQSIDIPTIAWDIADGDLDVLMQGIIHTDYINTVIPTYSKEILTHEYGAGLESILAARIGRIRGILNGLDTDKWNPTTDQFIEQQYDANTALKIRPQNKAELLKQHFPNADPQSSLLYAYVGRLDPQQKGLDLITQVIQQDTFIENKYLLILGVGDPQAEQQFQYLAQQYTNVQAAIRYDDQLAHQIFASSDFIIIPSRYEPCGLVQMMAMRYGSLPIVRRTGGLADTVEHLQTGFVFDTYNWHQLQTSINHAAEIYHHQPQIQTMVNQAMAQNNNWDARLPDYINLYNRILNLA